MNLENRKGATRISDIPKPVLEGLNTGTLESVNLTEWLAVDATALLEHILPALKLKQTKDLLESVNNLADLGIMQRTERIASLLDGAGVSIEFLSSHRSDTVRCWAAFIAVTRGATLKAKLEAVQPFAADLHFGVREIAWMAWRPGLNANLEAGLKLLKAWTTSDDANLRRFASEVSRPRGVWCTHIQALKDKPELAMPLLKPLRSDASKYVQASVANWLNDASKTQGDWVESVCAHWLEQNPSTETKWIVNRALRSLRKRSEST
jgi:3-methyladenine DNA glycosylase AlkC